MRRGRGLRKVDRGDFYPPDHGCELHPRCLTCPLPRCKHDMDSEEEQAALMAQRDAAIVRFVDGDGHSVYEAMARWRLSRRTVQRALAAGRRLPLLPQQQGMV